MLKKLLASALAVATVASCAYVPSALASAATVEYHTADVVKYMDWKLNTPDAPSTNVNVNIYVNTNVENKSGVYTLSVAPEKNTEADVKAALNDAKNGAGKKVKEEIGEIKETEAAVKYVVEYFYSAGTNTYVASVAKKRAVVYSTWNENLNTAIDNVKATTLTDNDVKLLGYYNEKDMASALAEITQAKYMSEVKVASYALKNWSYVQGVGDRVSYVKPVFGNRVDDPTHIFYEEVQIVKADSNLSPGFNAGALVAATYHALGKSVNAFTYKVLVPKSDSDKTTYITNYLKRQGFTDTVTFYSKVDADGHGTDQVTYNATKTVRKVADGVYAVTYKQADAQANVPVNYELNLIAGSTTVASFTATKGYTSEDAINWTTVPAELYALINDATNRTAYSYNDGTTPAYGDPLAQYAVKDTLANYLVQGKDSHAMIYELTEKYATVSVIKYPAASSNRSVTVSVYVTPKEEYTVYSYGANDTMKETKVYLSAAEADNTGKYNNQDGTTQIVDKKVTNADAAKLGVATSASIKGVPAEYAYAQSDTLNKIINCTYKTGASIGVALDDFQTATGEFQTEPYFGRDAKVGDQVTLKVSLTDAGVAKKLDLTKVTVEFAAAGVATVSENFDYAATEFPAGVATTLTLAQGTNIVTATVYYDGAKVGTFAPFYAYVG